MSDVRLIDANALKYYGNHIGDEYEDSHHADQWAYRSDIDNAPTIEPKQGEWIPCEERLPSEDSTYLVYAPSYKGGSSTAKEKHNGVMFSKYKNGKWSIEHGYYSRPNCVIAWMPLPQPYSETIVSKTDTDNAKYTCENCKHDRWHTKPICGKCVRQDDGKPSEWESNADCPWK